MENEELFNLPEGKVILRHPALLSPQSIQDLEDHLALIVRQLKRTAELHEQA